MAVRFTNEHTSWAATSPLTWKIEIHDADHVGGNTDFEVEEGLTIEWRGDGDDVLTPILASNATFSMMVQDATHEALITDMAGASEGRFTLKVYRDSVFHWAGVINTNDIEFEDWAYPFAFKISAVDGLALLKNYPCSQSGKHWDDVYEGQSKLVTIISRCLKKLPHVVTHFTGSSKFLVTAINWYNDLHASPVTSTYDPFWYTELDNRVFADGKASGAAKFISCYDAISTILTCFGARISLYDGYFLVEQLEHRSATIGAPANYSRYYDYALTTPTANTLVASQAVGGSETIKKLRGGSYSFLPALRAVRATQRLNGLQNLMPASEFNSATAPVTYAIGWVKADGLNTFVRLTGTIEWELENDSLGSYNDIVGVFEFTLIAGSKWASRAVSFGVGGLITYPSITWSSSSATLQIAVPFDQPAIGETWTGQHHFDFLFRTDSAFTYGDLSVTFNFESLRYFNAVTTGAVNTAEYDIDWVVKDAYLTIQEARTAFAPKSVTYEVSGDGDNTQELELKTIIGDKDGDIVNQWGGLLFNNAGTYQYVTTWGNRDGTRDRPIIQLLAQRTMQMQYFPRKVLRGTAVGSPLVVQVPLLEDSETYILKNGVYSTHRDELAGEWVKLAFANESLTYEAAEYDTGNYEATSPSGGGTGGQTPDTGGGGGSSVSGVTLPYVVQGDLLYGSAANTLAALGKSTSATRYLSNTGASNNPAWAQVDLTNGVTGALPFANIATISTGKLLGRYNAGTGVIEQITISTGLALDGSGNLTASGLGGTVTSVGVSGGTTGMTFSSSPITTSGTMTMSGTLVAANGGTGQSTYTVGDILYASAATTLTKLSAGTAGTFLRSAGAASPLAWSSTIWPNSAITGDVLYASAANTYSNLAGVATGNALISGGVSTAPSWGKIGLTTHVSGTLGATNGGTGQSTVTQGDLLYGSAANTWSKLAKDANATRYVSNTGTSNNPAWAQVDLTNGVTGTLPVGSGGTGATTFTAGRILYGNGTSALTTNAALMYTSSVLRVQNTSSATSYFTAAAQENIRIQNTDSTNGNWSCIANYTSGSLVNAAVAFENIDQSTRESALDLYVFGGGNFTRAARFRHTGNVMDKATSFYSTITVTGTSTFNGAATFNAGMTINTVAPTINTNLQLGSASVGSQLVIYNDYSSTSAAASNAWANLKLINRNATANNWSAIQWDSQTNAIVADVAVQYLDHTADTGEIVLHTRGASSGYGEALRVSSEKQVLVGLSSGTGRFIVKGGGATSATVTALFENSSGTDILYIRDDGRVSIGNSSPQQTLHVTGTMRLTGSDGTATAIMGRDGNGDISAVSLSADLAITSGTLGLTETTVITPSQITSNQNDYNPTGLSTAGTMLIYADNGFRQITGITAPSTAKKLVVANIGSYAILFPRESTSSAAANRIRLNKDFVLFAGKTAIFFYDTAATKWRLLSVGDSYEDSAHLYLDTQVTAPTQLPSGDIHWRYVSDGSDTAVAPTAGRWSGHELDTGATTSGIGTLSSHNPLFESSTTAGQGVWAYFKAHIKTPAAVSDGTNTYLVKAGFVDAISGGAVNGIYFSYDVGTSSSIYAITRASATTTSTNTGTAFGADTVHLLECVYRPNGTAEFYLNGVSVASHSTNVPLTDLYPQIIIQKTAGTTARSLTWYAAQTTLARVA